MKKILINLIFIPILIFSLNIPYGVSAENNDIKQITLLGDSITYGYGLSEDEHNYGWYLGEYYGAKVNNYAQNGLTTQGLMDKLEQQEIADSVKSSDLICISIGGNDILGIFINALMENDSGAISENGLDITNISPEFVMGFIMDYGSSLAPAATQAGENIKTIKNTIENLNPQAEIVFQTVYNPFESEDSKKNMLMKPLKSFVPMYLGTINNAVKEACPDTADINLKFSEKPYLYTNIESYDIHPNNIGHFLIAEEIVQTLGISGDSSCFKNMTDSISYGVFSKLPSYISSEIKDMSEGQLRRGTLEQFMKGTVPEAVPEITETTGSDNTQEETTAAESAAGTDTEKNDNKDEKSTKGILSTVFMVLGISILFVTLTFKMIRRKKKK